MATNRDLLKEAIADAKAVKEMAIANAKAALEEAFTPQLKTMLSAKLQEMELEEEKDPVEEGGYGNYEEDDKEMEEGMKKEKEMEEAKAKKAAEKEKKKEEAKNKNESQGSLDITSGELDNPKPESSSDSSSEYRKEEN